MGKLHSMAAAVSLLLASGCKERAAEQPTPVPAANNAVAAAKPVGIDLSLTRLDCGSATIKDFDSFFSDRPGLLPDGPRDIAASCYLIRHGDKVMIWDTGISTDLKGRSEDKGDWVPRLDKTLVEQLAQLGLKPEDVDIVGISHWHVDHTGQAAQFPDARLIVGNGDFELAKGAEDPFGPWRDARPITLASGDIDIFGDGSVVAVHLPGHTPDHFALLVKLNSGPVLLTGDLYHSTIARQKRTVPPFNSDRAETLRSMDRFEKLARDLKAKVIIQHEPGDIAKLPVFPKSAR